MENTQVNDAPDNAANAIRRSSARIRERAARNSWNAPTAELQAGNNRQQPKYEIRNILLVSITSYMYNYETLISITMPTYLQQIK